jgi:peptide/nickel transport system substrate-binding protein
MKLAAAARRAILFFTIALLIVEFQLVLQARDSVDEELLATRDEIGRYGGKLIISQRSEPKTLNPVIAADTDSRKIIALMTADLIHINRQAQQTECALAKSWTMSPDGRRYTLHLRRGLRFSDGQPFDADDVLFTFKVYLDERVHSSQRDLLIISGKPVQVTKIDAFTVQFALAVPYAAAERLFDGVAILPRHLLESVYEQGRISQAWALNVQPGEIAGLGPFRLRDYTPGQRITLERNPYFWKTDSSGNRLPYIGEIVSLFVGSADAEALRFESGETDIVSRLNASEYSVLERSQQTRGFRLYDLGPGLEYEFVFFNLNALDPKKFPSIIREQFWFRQLAFRRAVSRAIDREGIVRLVYRDRASPLWVPVTPGNKLWVDHKLPQPPRSLEEARQILREAGFSWNSSGGLVDPHGVPVEFSIIYNAGNLQHMQMATIIQEDLKQVGMDVRIVPLEFRTMLNRILETHDYEAAIARVVSGDADPNSELNVLTSKGGTHLWDLTGGTAQASWQEAIDRLIHQQLITLDYKNRKQMYDEVQRLLWENLPLICLVSPNILVGATKHLGNFNPAPLSDYTLWNVEELFFHDTDKGR